MIRANYTARENTHSLTVEGHAGYAEKGADIVCAGVSALVQALIGWMENSSCEVECISVDEIAGEVIVSCSGGEDAAAVFYMTAIGLEQIANAFPDYVEINIIGIAD